MNQKKLTLKQCLIWLLIMAAGIVLLMTGITHESLWYDESYSGSIANQPFGDIINITGADSHPPLYYLMLRLFRLIFGNSVFSLRAFSVLGALALAAWGIGPVRRAAGNSVGFIFTVLVLAIPITTAMAQESRMYTWSAFWVTGSALFGYLASRDKKASDWLLFVICSLCAGYTHYYALLAVVMVWALLFLIILIGKQKIVSFLIAAGFFTLGYLPWLLIKLTGQVTRVAKSFWIPPVTGKVIWNVLSYPFSNKFANPVNPIIVSVLFLIAVSLIVWGIAKLLSRKDERLKISVLAIGAYLMTIGAGVVASWIIRPVLVERYMMPVLGLFILALAIGIASLQKRFSVVLACCIFVVLSIPQITHTQTMRFNGPMTEAVAYMTPQLQVDDIFLHTDEHTFGTFCYYFPDHKHYYYQRKGYEGFSNYDAFKPNGFTIESLDEIENSKQVWLIQRFGAPDRISLSSWLSNGALKAQGSAKSFRISTSWYAFSILKTLPGTAGTDKGSVELSGAGNLRISISNLHNNKGKAMVMLFNQGPMTQAGLMSKSVPISDGMAEVVFENLPFGEYAVSVLHDENGNEQFDMKNEIPAEGFGTSNSFGPPQGPPEYESCKFRFDSSNNVIHISVFYLN